MKIFMLKSFMIAALMFISVLVGMQWANEGINKMKGYSDPNFKSALSLTEKNNKIKASVLGENISSHDLKAKKQNLEQMNAFNLFSSVGKKMSEGLSNASEKMVELIAK